MQPRGIIRLQISHLVSISARNTFLFALYLLDPLKDFFIKIYSNVLLGEKICITHDSAMKTQCQGHTSSLFDWRFNIVIALYILTLWIFFIKAA